MIIMNKYKGKINAGEMASLVSVGLDHFEFWKHFRYCVW